MFPLPDAQAPVQPTPVLPRFPVTSNSIFSPQNLVKPSPVLSRVPVTATTGNYYPNKFNSLPQSFPRVLSTKDVPAPANDLLPPKV